jgi:hypothetical protein
MGAMQAIQAGGTQRQHRHSTINARSSGRILRLGSPMSANRESGRGCCGAVNSGYDPKRAITSAKFRTAASPLT